MAYGNTAITVNESLFNTFLGRYIEANGSMFGGGKAIPALGIEFVYGLDGPPTVQLAPQEGGGNIALHFDQVSLSIYAYQNGSRGERRNQIPVKVVVTGSLRLIGTNLSLTDMKASGTGKLDEKAAAMMNETVIPRFQAQVAHIPLPDFTRIIGTPVTVTDLEVGGNQMRVFANVGHSNDRPLLPEAVPDYPAIIASISSGVINELAAMQFPGAQEHVGSSGSNWLGSYEASAGAGADRPQVHIANGQGYGSINVSAHASAGFKANLPFADWVRPGVSISERTPPLSLRLITHAKSVIVKVYMDGNIAIGFDLPSPLDKVADGILSIFRPLADAITGAVNSGLDMISINAFVLPNEIPGTNIPADLTFVETGFKGNSVQAVIRVG